MSSLYKPRVGLTFHPNNVEVSIVSYNVNGIRAAARKGMFEWVRKVDPEVICFQEIKALPTDIEKSVEIPEGYQQFWFPAQKKGYSGVGILSKTEPIRIERGCGISKYDDEGRILRADFPNFSIMSLYLPSGSSGDERQAFKEEFLDDFYRYIQELRQEIPNLVISGDFNICHKAIDIHNPVSNKNSSGFLPQEREWMTKFIDLGYLDSFRMFNQDPHHYTWWTYRAGARGKNKGWRIDYHLVGEELKKNCKGHLIHADAVHSDHCPIELTLEFDN